MLEKLWSFSQVILRALVKGQGQNSFWRDLNTSTCTTHMHMVRTISITVLIFDLYSRSYETYYINNNLITDFVHCTKRHAKQKQNKKLKQKLKKYWRSSNEWLLNGDILRIVRIDLSICWQHCYNLWIYKPILNFKDTIEKTRVFVIDKLTDQHCHNATHGPS